MVIMTATGLKIYHSPTSAEESVLGSAVSPAVAVFEADGTNHKVYCQVSYCRTCRQLDCAASDMAVWPIRPRPATALRCRISRKAVCV